MHKQITFFGGRFSFLLKGLQVEIVYVHSPTSMLVLVIDFDKSIVFFTDASGHIAEFKGKGSKSK